jgi:hypothetical protein
MPRPSRGLRTERWLPSAVALLVWVAVCLTPEVWLLFATWRETMLGDVIAASSILVAYLMTAATVLPAVEEKGIVRKLRAWGYYRFIIDYIGSAAWAAGALLVLSLAGIILPSLVSKDDLLLNLVFSATWWGLLSLTILCVWRATRILLKMLRAQ